MNLKVLGNRIIIKPDPEHKNSTLVVPETVKKHTNKGEVIQVGDGPLLPDGTRAKIENVKVGDYVMFGKLHAYPFKEGNQDLVLCAADDVLIVYEKSETPSEN